jgi:hypothetical protein
MNACRRACLFILCAVLFVGGALAQSASANGPAHRRGLEGTWMIGVASQTNNGGIPFLGLGTYMQDGQFLGESNTTTIKSVEHGEWFKVGPREYVRWTVNFRFSPPPAPPRTYEGLTRITARVVVNEEGDAYTGVSVTERFDIVGNLVTSSTNSEAARRCDSSTTLARCLGTGQ